MSGFRCNTHNTPMKSNPGSLNQFRNVSKLEIILHCLIWEKVKSTFFQKFFDISIPLYFSEILKMSLKVPKSQFYLSCHNVFKCYVQMNRINFLGFPYQDNWACIKTSLKAVHESIYHTHVHNHKDALSAAKSGYFHFIGFLQNITLIIDSAFHFKVTSPLIPILWAHSLLLIYHLLTWPQCAFEVLILEVMWYVLIF